MHTFDGPFVHYSTFVHVQGLYGNPGLNRIFLRPNSAMHALEALGLRRHGSTILIPL